MEVRCRTYAAGETGCERFLKIVLDICLGLTIMVVVMNSSSSRLELLKAEEARLLKSLILLRSGLSPEAMLMAFSVEISLSKVMAEIAKEVEAAKG